MVDFPFREIIVKVEIKWSDHEGMITLGWRQRSGDKKVKVDVGW